MESYMAIFRVIFLKHTEVIAQDYTTQSHKTVSNLSQKQPLCAMYRRQKQSHIYKNALASFWYHINY